jgi:hypothetical protein
MYHEALDYPSHPLIRHTTMQNTSAQCIDHLAANDPSTAHMFTGTLKWRLLFLELESLERGKAVGQPPVVRAGHIATGPLLPLPAPQPSVNSELGLLSVHETCPHRPRFVRRIFRLRERTPNR